MKTKVSIKRIEPLENQYGRIKAYAVLLSNGVENIIGQLDLLKKCDQAGLNINDIEYRPNEFVHLLSSKVLI